MNVTIFSFCPEAYPSILGVSIMKRAIEQGIWSLSIKDIKEFGIGKHKEVDDTPYGGGAGMVLKAEIVERIMSSINFNLMTDKFIYFTPRGKVLKQSYVSLLTNYKNLYLLAGRFEGIDQRAIEYYNIEEISIGDYVLAGGDVAAMALVESVVRLLPNVVGSSDTVKEESFASNTHYEYLLEYPQYTKPQIWKNKSVPGELLSGNHRLIKEWRFNEAQIDTKNKRPDLWDKFNNKSEN